MFTITDYYNLIDSNGYVLDAIHDYGLPFSETIEGLYNNFIDNTTKADQQTARNFLTPVKPVGSMFWSCWICGHTILFRTVCNTVFLLSEL